MAATVTSLAFKKLFDSLPWWKFEPSSQVRIRAGEVGSANPGHVAMRAQDGTGIMVYVIAPDSIGIDMTKLAGSAKAKATWFDPRNGTRRVVGTFHTSGEQTFATPRGWEDAVLILDAGLSLAN